MICVGIVYDLVYSKGVIEEIVEEKVVKVVKE